MSEVMSGMPETKVTYWIGYFSARLFDGSRMPLGVSRGEMVLIGGAAIGIVILTGVLFV